MKNYSHWYNLDLPETIAVREKLLPESGKISQIAMSAMEDWSSLVEAGSKPVLVIIEGLTMYLDLASVQQIFHIISRNFQKATVQVETMSPFVVKNVKEKSIEGSHAKFTWGVKDGKEIEKLLPEFRSVEDHSLVEGMEVFMPIYKLIGKIPAARNISNKILVLERI